MALTVYRCLLCLYPERYRDEFAEEMKSVFRDIQRDVPAAPAAKISFYLREFCGLVSGALRAHLGRLFGAAIPFRRYDMQPQFRFPRTTVFLMLVIFGGVVATIRMASSVAGDKLGSVWPSLISILVFMVLTMCTAAAVVCGILHALRRSGVHRLENIDN